jgi:hypothetical protein
MAKRRDPIHAQYSAPTGALSLPRTRFAPARVPRAFRSQFWKRGRENLTGGLLGMGPIERRWRRFAITNPTTPARGYSLTGKATCQSFAHPKHARISWRLTAQKTQTPSRSLRSDSAGALRQLHGHRRKSDWDAAQATRKLNYYKLTVLSPVLLSVYC